MGIEPTALCLGSRCARFSPRLSRSQIRKSQPAAALVALIAMLALAGAGEGAAGPRRAGL